MEDGETRVREGLEFILENGGPVAALLILLSVVALTMTIYKFWQFATNRVGRHGRALAAVEMWFNGDRQEGYELVADDRSPLSRVVAHAMRGRTHGGTSLDAVKEDVTRVALEELHRLRSYLRGIEVIAQTAPLLGLLGTVVGMIEAFSQLQASGAAVNPAQLAGGIWTALLSTALGLAVAIVFSTIGAWLESRVENERSVIETTLTGFLAQRITEDQLRGFGETAPFSAREGLHAR
jgi:biopolymer transport protein ExbB